MTSWITDAVGQLAARPVCGYHPRSAPASEPTALAALALIGHERGDAAQPALRWLARIQAIDGSVGISGSERSPRWPTSLAVLAWQSTAGRYALAIDRAINWTLGAKSKPAPRNELIGHDTTIIGWSWADNTHGWIEPTAMHILALKATGHSDYWRTREAVKMLKDRLLPDGGCNYGNTMVLGQQLRPHLMPTGLCLLALAREVDDDGRIARSLDWVRRQLSAKTTTASLAYGVLALAAHGQSVENQDRYLAAAFDRTLRRGGAPYKVALLAHAALGEASPLVTLPQGLVAS